MGVFPPMLPDSNADGRWVVNFFKQSPHDTAGCGTTLGFGSPVLINCLSLQEFQKASVERNLQRAGY